VTAAVQPAEGADAIRPGRRALTNFVSLAAGQVVGGVLNLATLTLLANRLQPATYGRVCFAEATLTYFVVLANFGLDVVGIRRVAQRPGGERDSVRVLASLRLAMAVGAFALLCILAAVLDVPAQTRQLVILYGATLLAVAVSLEWLFQGIQRMHWCGAALVLREAAFLGLCALLVRGKEQVLIVPLCYLASRALAAILLASVFALRLGWPTLGVDGREWRRLLSEAAPIGLSQGIGMAIYVLGTLVLGLHDRSAEVGVLNAATRPLMAFYLLASAFSSAVFPSLAAAFAKAPAQLPGLVAAAARWAWLGGLAVAFGATALGGWAIGALYPDGAYGASAGVFRLFGWAVAGASVNGIYSKALLACNGQRAFLLVVSVQLGTALLTTLALAPGLGAAGAALGMVLGEAVGVPGYYACFRWASRRG
jgi:PST family polysaccharide transporter